MTQALVKPDEVTDAVGFMSFGMDSSVSLNSIVWLTKSRAVNGHRNLTCNCGGYLSESSRQQRPFDLARRQRIQPTASNHRNGQQLLGHSFVHGPCTSHQCCSLSVELCLYCSHRGRRCYRLTCLLPSSMSRISIVCRSQLT